VIDKDNLLLKNGFMAMAEGPSPQADSDEVFWFRWIGVDFYSKINIFF